MKPVLFSLVLTAAAACAQTSDTAPDPGMPAGPQDVFIEAPDGARLAGTWWPADQSGPGIVLLGVAGPNDRRLSFGQLAPFEATAEALSEAGVHVLAYDDRGVGGSTGDWTAVGFEDMAVDAAAAADRLAQMPGVDPDRVGFFGLSEGAGVALHAVAEGEGDFLILGSPPGLPGEAALRARLVAMLEAQGASEAMTAQYLEAFDQFAALARQGDLAALEQFVSGPGGALVPPYSFVPRDPAGQARLLASRWHVAQLDYDPRPLLSQIGVPSLIVGGALDSILDPAINHPPLLEGIAGAEAVLIADANHLLIPAETGSPAEYASLSVDAHPDVVAAVLDWLRREGLLD